MDYLKKCSDCKKNEVMLEEFNGAAKKHQQVADELRDVVKNQRKKIQEFRELNSKLYDDVYSLEDDIRDKEAFVQKVVKERNDLQKEVKLMGEKLEVKNEDIIKIEFLINKQKEFYSNIVKTTEEESHDLKNQLKTVVKKFEVLENEKKENKKADEKREKEILKEIQNLESDVEMFKQTNLEKEILLEQLEQENKALEDENTILNTDAKVNTPKVVDKENVDDGSTAKSLDEELASMGFQSQTLFECTYCDSKVPSKTDLKKHVHETHVSQARIELAQVEKKVLEQIDAFTSSIHGLMKNEVSHLKEPCTCRIFCNINHMKHNWSKPASDDFMRKFSSIKSSMCSVPRKFFKREVKMGKHENLFIKGECQDIII